MCYPASFVVTRKKVFWSKFTDSHEEIIREFNLKDTDVRGEATFVCAEMTPPNKDWNAPLKDWNYTLQDIKPSWYDEGGVEQTTRKSLKEWYDTKVVPAGTVRKRITATDAHMYVLGTVKIVNGGTVQCVYDGGTVQSVHNGGIVQRVHNGGTVQRVYDGGIVQCVYDGGTVQRVHNGGTVQIVDDGTVQIVNGGIVQKIYSGTVQKIYSGTVQTYTKLPLEILKGNSAVLINRSDGVKCYTGKAGKSN